MNLSSIRGATYAVAFLCGLAAAWAAAQGFATYDPDTGMFDLKPFNVNVVAVTLVSAAGNLLGGIAWVKGWKRK